jgi:site-specific DNA recombinase
MEQPKPTPQRCAIYTRKSSEEGLEQEFNSLHAQREACPSVIANRPHTRELRAILRNLRIPGD